MKKVYPLARDRGKKNEIEKENELGKERKKTRTCGDSTSLLLTGSLTGAFTAEHKPPPQKQGSEHCSGAAFPLVPSQKISNVGSTDSTAAPSLSAPSRQSVRGHPVPQAALPWGSLLRSTANTFQKSPERFPPLLLFLHLYRSQSFCKQETTLFFFFFFPTTERG